MTVSVKFHFLMWIPFSNGDYIFTVVFIVIAETLGPWICGNVMSISSWISMLSTVSILVHLPKQQEVTTSSQTCKWWMKGNLREIYSQLEKEWLILNDIFTKVHQKCALVDQFISSIEFLDRDVLGYELQLQLEGTLNYFIFFFKSLCHSREPHGHSNCFPLFTVLRQHIIQMMCFETPICSHCPHE